MASSQSFLTYKASKQASKQANKPTNQQTNKQNITPTFWQICEEENLFWWTLDFSGNLFVALALCFGPYCCVKEVGEHLESKGCEQLHMYWCYRHDVTEEQEEKKCHLLTLS